MGKNLKGKRKWQKHLSKKGCKKGVEKIYRKAKTLKIKDFWIGMFHCETRNRCFTADFM